ncbi:SOS response-associated peptidase family protein [Sphingomonas sp.]|uniref:SOS response-associated peptidase family protein n=1 Tax=Sphingomonas sp. TaxID=28214 RepID=UPI00345C4B76
MTRLYRCRASLSEVAATFGADAIAGTLWQPTVWPGSRALIVRAHGDRRRIELATWGLPWQPGTERLATCLRDMMAPIGFGDRSDPPERCLIVLESFALPAGAPRSRTQSWFGLSDRPLVGWAGILREMPGRGPCFAGIAAPANDLIAPLSPTMPALLEPAEDQTWLTAPLAELGNCRRPHDADSMYAEWTDDPWPRPISKPRKMPGQGGSVSRH